MSTGWARVGEAILAAYEQRGWVEADLVRESGVSDPTIRKMERGHEQRYRSGVKRSVEQALGWSVGHIDDILRGEPAIPLDASTPPTDAGDRLGQLLVLVKGMVGQLDQLQAQVETLLDAGLSKSTSQSEHRARQ